ncbi:MAG: radical SAM protein [Nitrospirota bacterium]
MAIKTAVDFFIQWHLTERCNLKCRHCYQTGAATEEMSFIEIKEILGEISETFDEWMQAYSLDFSVSFNITGGEPFLRKDLYSILSEIEARGFDIYLLTNGILVDEFRARMLSDIGVKGVQVSMEGPEEIHDSIRGKGSFSSSVRGIRHLVEAGLMVTLNVTLSSVNAQYFMDMVDMGVNLGAEKLGFSRLVPSGRGEAMFKEMLDKQKLEELYKKIFSSEKGCQIVTGDPVASQLREKPKNDGPLAGIIEQGDMGDVPRGGCAAGVSGLTILPDGTMLPCRRLDIPIGNIRKDSLREVWATSPVLEALRNRNGYKVKCRECKRWANCRGCRAIAYAFSKAKGEDDFLAEDPQCFIT